MTEFMIELAKEQDIKGINRTEVACFSIPWSESAIKSEIENPDAVVLVAKFHGETIGWAGLRICFDEGDVTNVGVLPEYRGVGLGKALTTALIQKACEHSLAAITLEVRKSNIVALKMYEKLGLSQIGVRPMFYEKPKEDAVMMRIEINYDNI